MTQENNNEEMYQQLDTLSQSVNKIFIGQQQVVNEVLVALLARGHVLLEGVPGLGKTLLVKVISRLIDAGHSRIQFTPDLMPADVTGHMLYDHQTGSFKIKKGPVFTNLLLADEINRSPAKTQAALLEVMEEKQVTLEGEPLKVEQPFMVLATQNPIEQEGTYVLPEAQLDRFLLKVLISYPEEKNELEMLAAVTDSSYEKRADELNNILNKDSIKTLQNACAAIQVDKSIQKYILNIISLTRNHSAISYGAGPRGGIALLKCARSVAMLNHRDYVIPDDVKNTALAVLRHRIILSPEYELSGNSSDMILTELLNEVDAPRT